MGISPESLEQVVGLKLTRSTLAVDQRIFHFGPLRPVPLTHGPKKGGTAFVGSYALYVKCPWRFLRDHMVLTGSSDIDRYAGDNEPARWTFRDGNSLQHVKLDPIIASEPRVRTAQVNPISGDLVITFEDNAELLFETFSSSSSGEEWLFFKPGSDSEALVVFREVD